MKEIYDMEGAGYSIRDIPGELDIAPNTVRRYLKDPEAVMPKQRRRRASKLDPYMVYMDYMDWRLSEGLDNCVVLWREFQGLGYQGRYSLVRPTCPHAADGARFRQRCALTRSLGNRPGWTGAASATWTKPAASEGSGLSSW